MDKQPNKDTVSSVKIDGAVQGLVQGKRNTVNISYGHPDQASSRLADQNRQHFLAYLRTRYHDVLEQSLQGAVLIALGLHTRPEAIAHPAHLVFRHLNQSAQVLPPGTSILQVYDQASGDLLILGDPGAGKSTLLLHLAQGLLTRAEGDAQQLLPVIFNLSSWAQKHRPLEEWLVEELFMSYQVPRKIGKLWVQSERILPLLDGLDEVTASARGLCIDAINVYRSNYLVPLVICSRTIEYLSQQHRLVLQNAVVVQPLTTEQVDDYLMAAGPALATVHSVLHQNQVLHELAASPLILNVLMLAYRNASTQALPTSGSIEEQQRQIFAYYIKRMLPANKINQGTTSQQMLSRLIWLARQMQQHSQTVFYIEQLQPSWLQSNRLLWVYEWWGVRLPSILMGLLVSLTIYVYSLGIDFPGFILCFLLGGLLGGILSQGSISRQPGETKTKAHSPFWQSLLRWLGIGTFVGVGIGLSYGPSVGLNYSVSVGLGCGLYGILLRALLRTSNIANAPSTIPQALKGFSWQHLIRRIETYNGILAMLLCGLSLGLSYGLIFGLNHKLIYGLSAGLGVGLTFGLDVGLVGGLLSALLIGRSPEILPADRLIWSWRNLRKMLFLKQHIGTTLWGFVPVGLIFGLISYGVTNGLIFDLNNGLSNGLSKGLSFGLSYWLLLGLFQGVSSETVDNQQRIVPNQGIRRSLSNGLILGFASTVIVGSIAFLSVELIVALKRGVMVVGLSTELSVGLVIGLSIGLLVGLLNGGLAYLRHYILRFLLWRERLFPWKLSQFLDDAARHILLRKVGGGYTFIHRLFLDYIASLDIPIFPSQETCE